MTRGWPTKSLGEVCTVVNGGTPMTGVSDYWDGSHLWITPAEMGKRLSPYVNETERKITDAGLRDSSARMLPENSVILSSRAPIGHLVINTKPMATNQGCKGLVPAPQLDHKFLYYYLSSIVDLLNELGTGATFKELSVGKLKEVPIPHPSLPEQQRIVAILDEAFDGIATAKTNAEKNLQNARALFESHMQSVFARRGAGWVEKPLVDLCESNRIITYGVIKLGDETPNGVPCLRTSNVRWLRIETEGMKRIAPTLSSEYSRTILKGGEVLVNVRGTLGGVAVVAREMAGWNVSREVAVVPVDPLKVNPSFLGYLIGSGASQQWLGGVKKGAAYIGINIEDLRLLPVSAPNLEKQVEVARHLELLQIKTQRLESIYRQKLTALNELKKSLLHQAFTGQLTATKTSLVAPYRELQTTTPQFAANIISLAYARHAKKQRERTFGRVKEQKVLHLVEAISKINLGRQPMKDAAGPNDFQHMLKAEDWARAQDFFEMVERGNGYDLKKLKNFDKHLSDARKDLGSHLSDIEKVIDLLIPMDSEEAEVFATVHAAWNNLLIDGVEVTEVTILKEARETWHADKLLIPERKFKKSIEFIRSKGLIPDGTGKYVTGQKSLL